MVTFAQAAKLVVEHEYVPSMSAARLRKIAQTDPAWTVGEDDYDQVANAKTMPWALVELYFEQRKEAGAARGRGPDLKPRKQRQKPPADA